MNKRQKKKNYKKVYGINPPSPKDAIKMLDVLPEIINNAASALISIANRVQEMASNLTTTIKTLPDEEFEGFIQNFTPEQQDIARKIRGKHNEEL